MERNQGFSLIEVLVTIVLITVGFLGMLALQSKSIQYTKEAVNRNTAITLANDLVEMMRVHRSEFFHQQPSSQGIYTQLKASSVLYNGDGTLKLNAQRCSASNIAQSALEQGHCWLKAVEDYLPGSHEAQIKSHIKVCPSFTAGQCAGAGYQGTSLELQLAWRAQPGECDDSVADSVCTYRTRVEL